MERTMRKLLATLLTLSMVISMMSMTAFAQEEPENLEPVVTADPVVTENEEENTVEDDLGAATVSAAADVVPQVEGYNINATIDKAFEEGAKFVGVVASTLTTGKTTEVVGTVDAGYVVTLNIPNVSVNPNSLWLGIGMNNVASLGGDGVHALGEIKLLGENYAGTDKNLFETFDKYGLTHLKEFEKATLNVKIVDAEGNPHEVIYNFDGKFDNEGSKGLTVVATPEGDVSGAWHSMVNKENFVVDRGGEEDSQIVIANGSWLQIGNELLKFEDGVTEPIVLFANTDSDDVDSIRAKVEVVPAENDKTLTFCLKEGTTLGVGSSTAMLAHDVTVNVNVPLDQLHDAGLDTFLSDLRTAVNGEKLDMTDILIEMAGLLDGFVGMVNGNTYDIEISFAEESQSEGYDIRASLNEKLANAKFVGIVASTLTTGKTTEVVGTVDAGYNAKLVIPNASVNPNSLWLGIGMKDVASLEGSGVHALGEIKLLGEEHPGTDKDLFETFDKYGLPNLKKYGEDNGHTKITATIVGVDKTKTEVVYDVNGRFDNEGLTVTAEPDTYDRVSAAWHNMVNKENFTINRNTGVDDSQIKIVKGSWLQVGDKKLQFAENANGDIVLFTENGDNVQSILDKVELVTGDADKTLAFCLKKDTTLGVSTSSAALNHDVKVTVTGIDAGDLTNDDGINLLTALQTTVNDAVASGNVDMTDLMIELAGLLDKFVGIVNGKELNVDIEFVCEHPEDKIVIDEAKDATCVDDGLTEGSHCGVCGEVIEKQEVVPATGVHTYGELQWIGNRRAYHECSVCHGREYATVDVTDRVLIPAKHTTNGRMEYTAVASFGGEVVGQHVWQETIPALKHENVITDEAVEPTCTETGLTEGSHCGDCGEVFVKQEEIPALGHDYGETVLAADHATAGRTCTRCGVTETASVTDVTSVVTTPATRREPGVRTYTGKVTFADGKEVTVTWTEAIPRLTGGGSSSGGSTVVIDPTDVPLVDRPMTFEDVKEEDWFHEAVQFVFNKGLMEGESETEFEPYINTTRAMVAQILYRMEGKPSVADVKDVAIPDVTTNDWYHDAAVWAYSTGVYKGLDEEGTFGGEVDITREQLVEVMYRYAVSKKYVVTDENDLSAFEDKGDIGDWAERAMKWAVGAGLVKGRTETHIVPQDNAQRCELAMILMRFENKYAPADKK